ncbi:Stk1 family PASTA domain-containing Ser/Thr kinase [Georgenia wangjunii]|uniref:Stk1 family PASTA domain-containing Ser/Thr kinase n=1 Tax=Georgenia wangjunii TaxID=3117730 RepID=UPI003D9C567C
MVDEVPRVLGGRYEVGDLIGRGGMAEVHIGYDRRLSRTVAIKVLRSDLARDPTFQARFRREAQSAAALNHPAVVSVYDTGDDEVINSAGQPAHVPFIVMEYVEGHTVRSLLTDGTPVPIDEAVEIVAGILGALEYSHREGIVHRDIKPGNVMLTPTGAVKVMDFGIARAMADSAATMTQTHSVVGTAQYLSPEQARGEVVDARSDLYSTGCLLFELLTGQPPFSGDSAVAVAYQHVREIPRAPSDVAPDIPESLDRVVLKALAKDREERYPDAAAMRADLEAAVRGGTVHAPAVGAWPAAPAATTSVLPASREPLGTATTRTATTAAVPPEDEKRSTWWIWLLVLVGLAAAIGIGYLFITGEDNEQPEVTTVQVPPLEGMDQTEARQTVEDAELVFAIGEPEPSDTVEEGLFVSSAPAVGEEVETGETVTVRFSAGPDSVQVPDVEGMSQDQARDRLEEEGLTEIRTATVNTPAWEADRVASTEPAIGEPVSPDTVITLNLASGNVDVPDVVGVPLADAETQLRDNTLSTRVEEVPSGDAEPGTVLAQDRTGPVPRFTTILLTVAIEAPPVEPEPTEPATEEPPADDGDGSEEPAPPADGESPGAQGRSSSGNPNAGPGNNSGGGNGNGNGNGRGNGNG